MYLSAIERVLAHGRAACVLVPEISLTAQTVGRFRTRLGSGVAVFHSRLSAGERLDQWDMVRTGAARVVVGARSALFCPLENPGIIIIDEEHEQSYKQGSSPRYHAREVACEMARRRMPLVLGSATPSAEARPRRPAFAAAPLGPRRDARASRRGPAAGASSSRTCGASFPAGAARSSPVNSMTGSWRSSSEREKAVLLHNRRGFAPFLMCRECGCVPTCRHCSTALTYHERTHTLECHTCGSCYRVRPYPEPGSACPKCGSRYLAKMGLGTQQVEDALRALLPDDVAVIRMDADSTRGKDAHKKLLEEFDAAECAVLLGTQMIAKGLDFPEVTLAAVDHRGLCPLKMPDFRAGERAFDLLEQLAGSSGRGERPGAASIIQTVPSPRPGHPGGQAHDRVGVQRARPAQRRRRLYPPYVRLANVVATGRTRGRRARLSHGSLVQSALRPRRLPRCVRSMGYTAATPRSIPDPLPQVLGPVRLRHRARERPLPASTSWSRPAWISTFPSLLPRSRGPAPVRRERVGRCGFLRPYVARREPMRRSG